VLRLPVLALQKLYAEGGIPRFYKGFTPCLLRAFPANGIMLLTVDSVNNMLSDY
jgi:solute carrier family 25 carnitine/acylcarnitine transporter 20/29